MAELAHHRQVVGDEQHRQSVLALQVHQQMDDLGLHRNIQRTHRLVTDQYLGADHQGARNTDALALTARDFMRITILQLRIQTDTLHHFEHAGAALVGPHLGTECLQRFGDALCNAHARIEARQRVLENDLDLAAQRPPVGVAVTGDVVTVDADLPARRRLEPDQSARQRGLAATGFTDNTESLAGVEVEMHVVDRLDHAGRAEQGPNTPPL